MKHETVTARPQSTAIMVSLEPRRGRHMPGATSISTGVLLLFCVVRDAGGDRGVGARGAGGGGGFLNCI